jgi:hypothetical protein
MTTAIANLDPVELSLVARLAAQDFDAQVQSLARFLPATEVPDIRYAYSRGIDTLVDEATYRAFDAESPIGRRPGSSRITGDLLPISRKIPLSEYAALRLRNAGNDEVINGIYNDAARLARGIAARLERARGQLLTTGKVTLSENGLVTEYDSGRAAGLTPTALAGTAKWSDLDDSAPISDVLTWKALVKAASGIEPNRLIVSSTTMAYLQQNDEIRQFGQAVNVSTTGRVGVAQVSDAFSALASVTVEVYETPYGMTSDPIASNKVVLLRDNVPLGVTAYGITLEAQEPEYAALGPAAGVVAGAWKTDDPINVWTKAAAIALPLLAAPDCTLCCTVHD